MMLALWGSFWVRVLGAIFLGLVALKGFGMAKEYQGEQKGAERVTQAVTKKADKDASTAERIGNAALAGKGRVRNPYVRDDP